MPELEDRLRALPVEWPETPDVAAAVVARVERRAAPRPRRFAVPRGRLALVLALALLVPAGAAFAIPSVRDEVLDFLGLTGAEVRRVPTVPAAEEPDVGARGERVSLDEAARRAGFRPSVPAALGAPEEVRFEPASGFVTLIYDDVLVAQAAGGSGPLVEKIVGSGTGVRAVRVAGEAGVFIDGEHAYRYEGFGGPALAGAALIFDRGDLLVRVEGEGLRLDEALRIARSLR